VIGPVACESPMLSVGEAVPGRAQESGNPKREMERWLDTKPPVS